MKMWKIPDINLGIVQVWQKKDGPDPAYGSRQIWFAFLFRMLSGYSLVQCLARVNPIYNKHFFIQK